MNRLDLADGLRMQDATRGEFVDHRAHLRFAWAVLDSPEARTVWVEPDLIQLP